MTDAFGLAAFHYTCDQVNDPKATTAVNPGLLSATDHVHQVGNDRLVAVASNYGWVQVRQDEGGPKLLNGFSAQRHQYGGGIGYLTDGAQVLSTFYRGDGTRFERIFGTGYLRKLTATAAYAVDQVIFAPFGDDPVLKSQVTITNNTAAPADLRWVEYFGCQVYPLSFKLYMLAHASKTSVAELRHRLGDRFEHRFTPLAAGAGLLETKRFMGPIPEQEAEWEQLKPALAAHPTMFAGGAVSEPADEKVSFDDFEPPPTFLACLDGAADAMGTNAAAFFGDGGVIRPSGLAAGLEAIAGATGSDGAMLLERRISLRPGESRTLHFLYGYLPEGARADALIDKYRGCLDTAWSDSSARWKAAGLKFATAGEPWVARETAWNYYYLRSNRTYDSYFQEHIVSQGAQYTYVMGNQSSVRDPLQHALPFIFSDPQIIREILRYTLKTMRADGSIPYGIVGHGMPMPTVMDDASDIPLWLLWVVSEYVLATRDVAFLEELIPTYPLYGPATSKVSVRDLLHRSYRYLIENVRTGEHGVMRMLQDDWNDAVITLWVPREHRKECVEVGESLSNSAMAAYVFEHYARVLEYVGDAFGHAVVARRQAQAHRQAVQDQWTGKWFRRAWLGPRTGWLGERNLWLEPQPWALIAGVTTAEQSGVLVDSINTLLRRPSPLGAIQQAGAGEALADGAVRPPGMSVNGGVWPSLNATLVWALALVDPELAWEEWKNNSLARHAEVYPDVWYATWSGLDSVNSALNARPGRASVSKVFNQEDFPVMNMHSHACSLFGVAKLLGIEFTAAGFGLRPSLPVPSYCFESPLLGVRKSASGYEGWYAPQAAGVWSIYLRLPAHEVASLVAVVVNAVEGSPEVTEDGAVKLTGASAPGKPLSWAVRGR